MQPGKTEPGKMQAGKVQAGKVRAGKAGKLQAEKVQPGKIEAGKTQGGKLQAGQVQAGKLPEREESGSLDSDPWRESLLLDADVYSNRSFDKSNWLFFPATRKRVVQRSGNDVGTKAGSWRFDSPRVCNI